MYSTYVFRHDLIMFLTMSEQKVNNFRIESRSLYATRCLCSQTVPRASVSSTRPSSNASRTKRKTLHERDSLMKHTFSHSYQVRCSDLPVSSKPSVLKLNFRQISIRTMQFIHNSRDPDSTRWSTRSPRMSPQMRQRTNGRCNACQLLCIWGLKLRNTH